MKLIISDAYRLATIQQDFHALFPFLKLEFFSKLHQPGQPTPVKFLQPNKSLGEIHHGNEKGEITITPETSVLELEQPFGQLYGLGIQVFRKSGRSWPETTFTDNWSLQKQNAEGEFLSTPFPSDDPVGYPERE